MAEAVIRLDTAAIKQQLMGTNGAAARDLVRRAQRVQNMARRECPVDQGRLRGSITFEVRGSGDGLEARIGSNLKYAIYVEKGTGIHAGRGYIYPRGQFLRWPNTQGGRYSGGSTGSYVFARRIKGMKAQPFLEPALRAAA